MQKLSYTQDFIPYLEVFSMYLRMHKLSCTLIGFLKWTDFFLGEEGTPTFAFTYLATIISSLFTQNSIP